MPRIRTAAVATALTAACLAAPAGAGAQSGSIAYVKDHDVWIANPDGSSPHRVTDDGTASWPYRSPSQADDGTIAAAHGTDIVRLRQNGQELSRFDPPDTTDSAGQAIGGHPVQVALSPGGATIAYTYYQAGCPVGASCGSRYVMLYSHADRATPPETFGKLFRNNPSWVSDGRLLAFGGFLSQVNHDAPGGGDDSDVHWFDDHELFNPSTDLGDGELARQGDRFAALRSYGADTHLMFYKVTQDVVSGTPSGPPALACKTGTEQTLDSPTWAPDGQAIAFSHRDGVEVLPLPSVEPDCPGARSGTVVIPGGSEPDWGPAAVNPGPAPAEPRAPAGPSAPAPGPAPAPAPAPIRRAAKPDPVTPAVCGARCAGPRGSRRPAVSPRARCLAKPRKAARTRCLKQLERAAALRSCARKPSKAARQRCVRNVDARRGARPGKAKRAGRS